MSDRQYALWDCKDLGKPLTMQNIDTGSGVLFPFWDEGCKVVYVIGKVRGEDVTGMVGVCVVGTG